MNLQAIRYFGFVIHSKFQVTEHFRNFEQFRTNFQKCGLLDKIEPFSREIKLKCVAGVNIQQYERTYSVFFINRDQSAYDL